MNIQPFVKTLVAAGIDGKPALFYSQPSMPMVAHHYNFETKSWDRLD
jgi:hypothetical protein